MIGTKLCEFRQSLKNSEFIKKHLEILALRETPLEKKEEVLSAALDFPVSDYTGQEVVYQLAGETSETAIKLYKKYGFKEVGVLKAHYKQSTGYQDVMLMEHLLASG